MSVHNIKIKDDQYIWARSPVRLDLAGGWTDTPPYTFRYGGKVTNVAVNLNDELPVQVYIRRSPNTKIKLQSIDLGISQTITDLNQIEKYNNPRLPFVNAKAALHLLGFNKETIGEKTTLSNYLKKIGGGFEITTFVAVPKGSGLGVSSILSATLLAALHKMFEHDTDHHIILNRTLKLEQMFAAGGGWQDQIGGMIGGVKYIESQPCDESKFVVDLDINHLDPFLFLNNESQKCFTLYYTGITRLAKSILKNVVSRVVNEEKEYLDIHDNIKHLAERARSAISKRNITDLGNTIKESWDANKNIHDSTSNEYIDNLLKKLKPYYIGAKLLGAGGGGYCLFVSESPEQAQKLRKKINELSKGTSRIVEWSLNTEGLRVSLS
jgi:galactokinase/mevalonate kinase-like predicted kinase